MEIQQYHQNFPVLGDEESNIIRQGVLLRSRRVRHQVVVVNEVVPAEGDQNKRLVHPLPGRLLADEGAQALLILPKVLQLLGNPEYVNLHI